jgi:hypothetical protein
MSSKDTTPTDLAAPEDRRNLMFLGAYFVGMVMLLPWNMLITVNGYWDYKFRNTSLDNAEVKNVQ